jgi:L-threonylcarbamoyladenylate synthase
MASQQIYVYPTDTVWGLGCDLYSEEGFREIARIKKTTSTKPLSILFADVEQVMSSFICPEKLTKEWLTHFFLMESTLGIPKKWAKIQIPEWAVDNSEYVSIRCLNTKPIRSLYSIIGNPFFTTSLNVQGETPIIKKDDALKFCSQYCPSVIIMDDQSEKMSGRSSSMIFINIIHGKWDFEVKREGHKLKELQVLLNQLRLV